MCGCVGGKSVSCEGVWYEDGNDHGMETHSADGTGYVLELVYHLSHP